jgi:hypothetical protein
MRMGVVVALVLLTTAACSDLEDCKPTRMTAEPATKVDLSSPGDSSVLQARLTTKDDKPLAGMDVLVEVLDDGDAVYTEQVSTDDDGSVRHELVGQLDPNALQGLARGDAWRATFDGTARYCSSDDRTEFKALATP